MWSRIRDIGDEKERKRMAAWFEAVLDEGMITASAAASLEAAVPLAGFIEG